MQKAVLIIGAGITGITIAQQFAEADYRVTLVEKRAELGGNCSEFYHPDTNTLAHKYGAHIFHTNSKRVWDYVNQFCSWKPYKHKVLSKVGNVYTSIPVNKYTVQDLIDPNIISDHDYNTWLIENTGQLEVILNAEHAAKARVGVDLYNKLYKGYTTKMWGKHPRLLDRSVTERIPVNKPNDVYYFSDTYEGLPDSYTALFTGMTKHPNIHIHRYKPTSDEVLSWSKEFDYVFWTGRIDEFYENYHGALEYRSLKFKYTTGKELMTPVVNYPDWYVPYTRRVDHTYLTKGNVDGKHLISTEYPTDKGEPMYPMPDKKNKAIFESYAEMYLFKDTYVMKKFHFIGRLAEYKYKNMDKAVEDALDLCEELI